MSKEKVAGVDVNFILKEARKFARGKTKKKSATEEIRKHQIKRKLERK